MRYCFAVIYPGDAADPQLLVCGSVRELGTWNVDHAVAMTSATSFCTQEMSFWQVTVSIDDDDHSDEASAFFYKYVIRYNKGTVLWEGRDELDNRSYRRQQCDLVDGVYLIPTSFWNYTMAVTTGTNTDHGSWHQLSMTLFYHNICSEQSINFSKVSDKIYFGSCPRKFYHVAVLKSLGISAVLTLQTEADLAEHCRPLFYSSPCCDHELVFKLQTLYR
ncbi:unnamed protein product, partial [Soboliphyme baturini]|uniref:CBM20 domain-containing protein n=1 Tax=Soboliphyme baturini TaxID=241478 RepID=A0A183J703_9BILA